jgi:hypothetical protein
LDTSKIADPKDLLGFTVEVPLVKGVPFLAFMKSTVKPKLDTIAINGFKVRGSAAIDNALKVVAPKVSGSALANLPAQSPTQPVTPQAALDQLDNALVQQQSTAPATLAGGAPNPEASSNFEDLDDQLMAINPKLNFRQAGNLATFIALASGGGVAVRIDPNNIYYNVMYGTGANQDTTKTLPPNCTKGTAGCTTFTAPGDEVTGRSFGAGAGRGANDVSDADYLAELQSFLTTPTATDAQIKQHVGTFYQTLMMVMTNSDPTNFALLPNLGQTVATDFTAVYTAEQDRHLMENLQKFQFDVALAEVTFVSAFSASGSQVRVEFNGQLLSQVPNINPDTKAIVPGQFHQATLMDWTRLSPVPCHTPPNLTGPSHPGCNRSGPNETKADRRLLQKNLFGTIRLATAQQFPTLLPLLADLKAVEAQLNLNGQYNKRVPGNPIGTEDLFQEITNFLINASPDAVAPLANADAISKTFGQLMFDLTQPQMVDFLAQLINQEQQQQPVTTLAAQPGQPAPPAPVTPQQVQTAQQVQTDNTDVANNRPQTTPELSPSLVQSEQPNDPTVSTQQNAALADTTMDEIRANLGLREKGHQAQNQLFHTQRR